MPVKLIGIEEHFSAGVQISGEKSPAKVGVFVVLEEIENGRLVTSLQYTHVFENQVKEGERLDGRSKKPRNDLRMD